MIESWLSAGTGSTRIVVGKSLGGMASFYPDERVTIVTDETLLGLYGPMLKPFDVIVLPSGETGKSLGHVERLYEEFCARKLTRESLVVAFGGGAVSDCVGFAAATYLRGLRLSIFATTLLAQADAAIGGKNGVNLGGYKNLVGTIRQPELCVFDVEYLLSLAEREFRGGFAEIIKHAVIADAELFSELENRAARALERDLGTLEYLVAQSVRIKSKVVQEDENESDARRLLNFGHTIGHSVELQSGLPHGEAVAIGMVREARLCVARGTLISSDCNRIEDVIRSYGLPTDTGSSISLSAIERDKKRTGDQIQAPILRGIGLSGVVRVPLSEFVEEREA